MTVQMKYIKYEEHLNKINILHEWTHAQVHMGL
jgi:hypothetical protein